MKACRTQGGELYERAKRLTAMLEGVDLLPADFALDEARRFVWTMNFTGLDYEAVKTALRPSVLALQIAFELSGLTPLEMDGLLNGARHLLWVKWFALKPGTLFGRKYAALAQSGKPSVDREKMI